MARACLKCGHENPDDVDFCEQCGEYVRWELSGVRQAVPAPPPAQQAPPPAEAAPPVGGEPSAAAPPPPVAPAAAPPPEVAPPPVEDGGGGVQAPSTSDYVTPEQEPEPDSVMLT